MLGRRVGISNPWLAFVVKPNPNCEIRCSYSPPGSFNSDPLISRYDIPKLEPFSRSKLQRALKEPPLIQKSQTQLADYCSVLQGDDSYDCWKAYFELKELQHEASKEQVERLIMEAGGVKSLVGCVHGVAAIHKANKQAQEKKDSTRGRKEAKAMHIHIPDGLPRPAEEIEEEEKGRMPDSDFTRMLRVRGTHPAWD